MDKRESLRKSLENLKPGVLRYSLKNGEKAYFVVTAVKDGEIYGGIVSPLNIQGSVSIESVLDLGDLEKAVAWKKLE